MFFEVPVFSWTHLASWNFVLNGACVALGKICFSNVSSWKLQIYSHLYSFHEYYLSFYSSSICLLLLPCTFPPSPHSFTHAASTTFMSTDHLVSLDIPPPHPIFFKTCLSCVFSMLLIVVPSFLIFYFILVWHWISQPLESVMEMWFSWGIK